VEKRAFRPNRRRVGCLPLSLHMGLAAINYKFTQRAGSESNLEVRDVELINCRNIRLLARCRPFKGQLAPQGVCP